MRRALPLLALLAMPGVAGAQETGTAIERGRPAGVNGFSTDDARQTMRAFGECVVGHWPGSAARVVSMRVDNPGYHKELRSLGQSDCLSTNTLQIPEAIMRGALFEALYLKRFGNAGPINFGNVKPIDYFAGYDTDLGADQRNMLAMSAFGDCVARLDGLMSRMLVVSRPASQAERTAFATLAPKIGQCVPKGAQVSFARSALRGAVAEGLYRLSVAASAS